ncbi:MAG: hypothetical protein U1F25_06740 [Rubrivivax sp.]
MYFDFARSLPETNALQNGMRKKSGKMIMDASATARAKASAPTSRPTSA